MDGVDGSKRCQFGTRFLQSSDNVFEHNAWDNVEWDEHQEIAAREKVESNSGIKLSLEVQKDYDINAGYYWNEFYAVHQNRFFKDRHWLFTEFPELAPVDTNEKNSDLINHKTGLKETTYPGDHTTFRIFEVGCGVGNTVFPILQTSNDPNLFIYCCDLSTNAISIIKENANFDIQRCHAFVCDVADPLACFPFPPESLNVIVLVFVLSAIDPKKLTSVVKRLSGFLKPGGIILFRDYGRYDLTQLRFKPGRCLADNCYVRGDGTKVYYFTQDELRTLFTEAGLVEEQNLIDRRLQVNRGRQLKMYRVWIQCKYRKL